MLWLSKVYTYSPELIAGNKVVVLTKKTDQRFCKVKVTCICIMPEVPVSLYATLTNLFLKSVKFTWVNLYISTFGGNKFRSVVSFTYIRVAE